jgi:DNA-binding XRE family transcriptional regulator
MRESKSSVCENTVRESSTDESRDSPKNIPGWRTITWSYGESTAAGSYAMEQETGVKGKQIVPHDEVFDTERFLTDVEAFRVRQGFNMADLREVYGVTANTYMNIRAGRSTMSLVTACLLAEFADLSLDKYRKISE